MKQILNIKPLDIVPFSKGFIVVIADGHDSQGNLKISFLSYDISSNKLAHSTKSVYLLNKFGSNFNIISEQISDFISCAVGIFPNKRIHLVYPTGEMGTFDSDGTLLWTGDLIYHDSPVRSIAVDDKFIWCTVPEHNSIIRYSPLSKKVDFRIGGENSKVLKRPMSVLKIDDALFVCNKDSNNISKISLDNFVVNVYKAFEEPVLRYLTIQGYEVVVLSSGIYIL
ncbi:MAG: hypothetical protein ACOYJN_00260 [Acutalibacteraceae bacterium]|jgi:hypothetical protein|nr:hypothetical protein [Clostridiales bacterium]